MATLTFDTLKFAKRLKDAGFTDSQAEAISDALREAQQTSIQDLATKADLRELELRIIKWVVGMAGAQAALIVTLLKLIK